MSREQYSLEEARRALGLTKSGLEKWIRRAGIEPTRDTVDMRLRWLSRAQVEQLAAAHRRTLADTDALDVHAVDAALTERIEALERWQDQVEQRLAALERPRMPYRPPRPSADVSFDDAASQNRSTDTLEGISEGRRAPARINLTHFAKQLGVAESTARRWASEPGNAHQIGRFYELDAEQQEAMRRRFGK